MDRSTSDTLTERVDRLEGSHRRLRRGNALMFVGLAAIVLMGQAVPGRVPKVVEAERFVLRDRGGTTRAELTVEEDGDFPRLTLYAKDETPGAELRVSPGGAGGLTLWAHDGKIRAELDVERHGSSHLRLYDKNMTIRASLDVNPEGLPSLYLGDPDWRSRAELEVAADGSTVLKLYDKAGKIRASLAVKASGLPRLEFSDRSGKVIWKAP